MAAGLFERPANSLFFEPLERIAGLRRRIASEPHRQIGRREFRSVGENHRFIQNISEFANIAWPGIVAKQLLRILPQVTPGGPKEKLTGRKNINHSEARLGGPPPK